MPAKNICFASFLLVLVILIQVKNAKNLKSTTNIYNNNNNNNDDVDTTRRRGTKRDRKAGRRKEREELQKEKIDNNNPNKLRPSIVSQGRQGSSIVSLGQSAFASASASSSKPPILQKRRDPLMISNKWDVSPIVIEEYKLLFFSVPKIAATTFKHLFRRMMGHANWNETTQNGVLPHAPAANGLTYLWHYNITTAEHFMTSPEWTRAIFVRDPQARLVSAYKDKVLTQNGWYMRQKYCGITQEMPHGTTKSPKCPRSLRNPLQSPECQNLAPFEKIITKDVLPLDRFMKDFLIKCPDDPHWKPQAKRLAPVVWKQLNFVGRFEHLYDDARRLLEQIGAWDKYGSNGWEGGAIFKTNTAGHRTSFSTNSSSSSNSSSQLFMPKSLELFYDQYRMDYEHSVMNFAKPPDFPETK
jgi:hypothetical protein